MKSKEEEAVGRREARADAESPRMALTFSEFGEFRTLDRKRCSTASKFPVE
jgi:hypothetical protein